MSPIMQTIGFGYHHIDGLSLDGEDISSKIEEIKILGQAWV